MTKEQPRIALVTGAGSGIGRASSLALARTGFTVVLTGRREETLRETARMIADLGGEALAHAADVGDPAAVEQLFTAVRERFGRLDFLFNNAGRGGPPSLLEDIACEDWQRILAVNLTGVFLCTQHAFRIMKAQEPRGGRIVNNGSISAHAPRPDSIAYTATKHAVTGLTKSTSLDGRKYDIACGQIDIGNAVTDLAKTIGIGMPQPDGRTVPEPMMQVDTVADAIVFMAGLPLTANVQFLTVMATKMPYIGRG